jgi:hypothetical protein
MGRHAQIQFGEAIMVIVVLLFLITVGIIFYFNYLRGSLVEETALREDVESITFAKVVLAMSELRCAGVSAGCVDLVAADALASLNREILAGKNNASRDHYDDLFGLAYIQLHITTGTRAGSAPLALYGAILTGEYDATRQFLFTLVRDPITGEDSMGYLNVTAYRRVSP